MEFTTTLILLFSLSTQWFPMIKGSSLKLDRQEKDTIFDLKCARTSRATGGWTECTCKSEYATVMSDEDHGWNCYTPTEIGCKYYLGETDKTYVITKSNETVEFVPSITGNDTSIENIFIWNYRLDTISDYGHWDDVTDAALRFFALDHSGKNKLLISDLDLNKWRGHAIKIVLGGGGCVVAKMKGGISHPINVDKFKHSLNVTTPVTTTTPPSRETTLKTTKPITSPTATTQRKSTIIIKTKTPETTASGITKTKTTKPITPPTTTTQRKSTIIIKTKTPETTASGKKGKRHSKALTTFTIIGVVLIVVLVATLSTFLYRRRRSATHEKFNENTEKKLRDMCVENIHHDTQRDASCIVKSDTATASYAPNETCNGIEHVVDDKSLGADDDVITKKVVAAQ